MLKNINSKLKDNRGWGLTEMLVLSGILLLALLFAAYLIEDYLMMKYQI